MALTQTQKGAAHEVSAPGNRASYKLEVERIWSASR